MEKNFKVGIYTLGCRVNQYESEAISEAFERNGGIICDCSEECDVYVINTCAVTEESVRKSRQIIRRMIKTNPNAFVCVCGCASQLDGKRMEQIDGVSLVCGNRNKNLLVSSAVDYITTGTVPKQNLAVDSLDSPIERMSISEFRRVRAYVKIEDGCNFRCSYCIIPTVRGKVVLRDRDDIVSEVKELAKGGLPEVVLTGIETSAYGDGLAELLFDINEIDGVERIRMGSLYPTFLKKEFIDRIAGLKKVMPHFHISVQSGSDRILRLMRRGYSAEDVVKTCDYIRKVMPEVCFTSDIIVGFPHETEEDFLESERLIERTGMLHTHIFAYSKRPGTPAAEMDGQLPEDVKSDRSKRLHEVQKRVKYGILKEITDLKKPLSVLFEQHAGEYQSGHTPNFIEVRAMSDRDLRGKTIKVIPSEISDGVIIGSITEE